MTAPNTLDRSHALPGAADLPGVRRDHVQAASSYLDSRQACPGAPVGSLQLCQRLLESGRPGGCCLAYHNVSASPRRDPSALRQTFDELVMCDFTPRHPTDLPTSQWVSYPQLVRLFKPHTPFEVWHKGPGNLRQLIVEWYKDDPTFAGLAENAWCKRVKINDPQEHPGSGTSSYHVYKFCFEYTPRHFPGL